jgi:hypothetical protein
MSKATRTKVDVGGKLFPVALAVFTAVVFSWSIRPAHQHFDYTYRIAGALLHGHLGLSSQPPSWLNEMVPTGREYYSVFPLGAVLAVLPIALLGEMNLLSRFPGGILASLIAGLCVYSFYQLAGFEPNLEISPYSFSFRPLNVVVVQSRFRRVVANRPWVCAARTGCRTLFYVDPT